MLHKLSLALILVAGSATAMESSPFVDIDSVDMSELTISIPQERIHAFGNKRLFYNKDGFFIADDEGLSQVNNYDTDKIFRGRTPKDIAKYTLLGKFRVKQFDNGEYTITSAGEIKGGGPVLAWTLYCATKIGIYGSLAGAAAAGTAAIVATGGAAAPAVGYAGVAAGSVIGGAAGSSAAIGAGTAVVAHAVAGSAAATGAVTAVGTSALAGGATMGTVEALATAAFIAGMAAPTP